MQRRINLFETPKAHFDFVSKTARKKLILSLDTIPNFSIEDYSSLSSYAVISIFTVWPSK